MNSKAFRILLLLIIAKIGLAQNIFSGCILASDNKKALVDVEIHDFYDGFITKTDKNGNFKFLSKKQRLKLVLYKQNYDYKVIDIDSNNFQKIFLELEKQIRLLL